MTINFEQTIASSIASFSPYVEGTKELIDETSPIATEIAKEIALASLAHLNPLREFCWHNLGISQPKTPLNKKRAFQICELTEIITKIITCVSYLFADEKQKECYFFTLTQYTELFKKTLFESEIEGLGLAQVMNKLRKSPASSSLEALLEPDGFLSLSLFHLMIGISNKATLQRWLVNAGLSSKEALLAFLEKEGGKNLFSSENPPFMPRFASLSHKPMNLKKKPIYFARPFFPLHRVSKASISSPQFISPCPTGNLFQILKKAFDENQERALAQMLPEERKAFNEQWNREFTIQSSKIIPLHTPLEAWDFLVQIRADQESQLILEHEKRIQGMLQNRIVRETKIYRDYRGKLMKKTSNRLVLLKPTICHMEYFQTKNGSLIIDFNSKRVMIERNGKKKKRILEDIDVKPNGAINARFSKGFLYSISATTHYWMDYRGNIEEVQKLPHGGVIGIQMKKIPLKNSFFDDEKKSIN